MMRVGEIETLFARHAGAAEIALIEGNKGLYDAWTWRVPTATPHSPNYCKLP